MRKQADSGVACTAHACTHGWERECTGECRTHGYQDWLDRTGRAAAEERHRQPPRPAPRKPPRK